MIFANFFEMPQNFRPHRAPPQKYFCPKMLFSVFLIMLGTVAKNQHFVCVRLAVVHD
jgi:hypothetical protein